MSKLRVYPFFTQDLAAKTGLTLADIWVDIYRVTRSDWTCALLVNHANPQAEVGGGYYLYHYDSADYTLYDYIPQVGYSGALELDADLLMAPEYQQEDVSSRTTLGSGATAKTYTLTDSGTALPIADADVWVTTDEAGANVVASGKTDAFGQVTFYLDSGTYYLWRQRSGYTFSNPDCEAV
jgi:hypothetical protein